ARTCLRCCRERSPWRARSSRMQLMSLLFFHHAATTAIYTLSLHDALPISVQRARSALSAQNFTAAAAAIRECRQSAGEHPELARSEEHTSELQSLRHLVCRLLLEKKKIDQLLTQLTADPKIFTTLTDAAGP